jgi:LysR family transcriptional regulator for metE and metH
LRSSGSLVRAAQLLNLTQSALSHQIKLLEDRYTGRCSSANRYRSLHGHGRRLLELADLLLPEIELAEREWRA